MLLFLVEHIGKLWDTWNIRGLIILSLLLQSFLILVAPLRKQRGGKWIIMISLWIAYLLADWVGTFTIGLMLRVERSDILVFWAPFLLLHLGGPDTITSFSLEDNEFWIRHLLGLILQVGSTVYVILQSLPHNKLWLPTHLVLIAGIIKYAERNCAFYLASFDNFGNNWTSKSSLPSEIPPTPVQFYQTNKFRSVYDHASKEVDGRSIISTATCTFGAIKSLLVGPPMINIERLNIFFFIRKKNSHMMLRTIEIHLSLLYELLHSKLPVVDSKIGYVCRIVNFGCILGALVSFSLLKKHCYKLGEFDIWLTYGLLIGALALDLISILLLISSDWILITRYSYEKNYDEFNDKRRWSNSVPQLNVFACHFKNKDGDYSNKLVDFLGIRSLFETIRRGIRCVSHENFLEDQAWKFIFTTLKENRRDGVTDHIDTNFAWTFNKFEYMESLLIWHIATEICYQKGCPDNSPSSSTSTSTSHFDHRKICKLISDYMFYLLVMEPTMTATSPSNLKIVFEVTDPHEKWKWPPIIKGKKGSRETFIKDLEKILEKEVQEGHVDPDLLKEDVDDHSTRIASFSRIAAAFYLANELLNQSGGCPWELMGRFWVEIACYAANNCQPIVHARQVSKGGQLLTLLWLLINYDMELTPPSMDWYNVLERKEPAADQKQELKEPVHEFEITSATS